MFECNFGALSRPDYGGEQQQQQYQQYREPEFVSQAQPSEQQVYGPSEYEQLQYQQPSSETMQQQYQQQQPQPTIPQSPRAYAQQNMSSMQGAAAPGQYQEFVDSSGYVESRQGRDVEGTVYAAPTGGIRDSPTLDRARQSPTGFRQQSPLGTAVITPTKQSSPKQEVPVAPTAAPQQPTPVKKSPSPPVTTEVVPPVTQINQTIRKEVTAPSTTSTARRGTRPPTLRSVTARARAAASSARGGNR